MGKSKNDTAWEKLFQEHNILQNIISHGHTYINSVDINKHREARLMTKFDHKSQLPELFIEHGLSILPISRGGYIIGKFEAFHKFNKDDVEITKVSFPSFLESLDYGEITSEATAINCAFVSEILHDFTGENKLYPTVSGRMSSSSFDFTIDSIQGFYKINVGNSQVEIDGGYEGSNSLTLIEAKNYPSEDFLIRQLFYPYKLWTNKIAKKVRPVFLTYTNGIFHLREYTFEDIAHYNSIRLVKQKKYAVYEGGINIEAIQRILHEVNIVPEPAIPFPQADSFERVISLCEILYQKETITKEELLLNYDFIKGKTFDKRQINYYTDAARYLNLVDKKHENGQIIYFLTPEGQSLFKVNLIERQLYFLKHILSHQVFNKVLRSYFDRGFLEKNNIVEIMKVSNLYEINSDSTYNRRASTVNSWINWILDLIEE